MLQTAASTHLPAAVARKLTNLRRALFFWLIVHGLGAVALVMAALVAASIVLDWYFRMDRPSRAIILFAAVAAVTLLALRVLARPLSRKLSDDALVLRVEAQHRHLGQALISALQFSRIERPGDLGISSAMMGAAIAQGVRSAGEVDFGKALDQRFRRRSLWLSLVAGLSAAVFVGLFVAPASAGFMRTWAARNLALSAHVKWPQKTYLALKNPVTVVARGDDWDQMVEVQGEIPRALYIEVRPEEKADASEDELAQTSDRNYRATIKNVLEAFSFRVRGGDDLTAWFHVAVVDRPRIEKLVVFCTAPAYTFPPGFTGARTVALPPADGSFEVLPGSTLHFAGQASKPLKDIELSFNDKPLPGVKVRLVPASMTEVMPDTDGPESAASQASEPAAEPTRWFAGSLGVKDLTTGNYSLSFTDTQGYAGRQPTRFTVRLIADRKPIVRVELQGIGGIITPRATVRMDCRADDDFAVAGLKLLYQASNEEAQSQPSNEISLDGLAKGLGARKASCLYHFEVQLLGLRPGAQLMFHVEARDRDDVSGPNIGSSSNFFLKVVTDEVLRNELLRKEQEQRQEFERLIKDQELVLIDCLRIEAETAGKPALGEDEAGRQLKADLMKDEKRIRLAAERCTGVSRQFRAILAEVLNNKLEDENGPAARKINGQIIDPLAALVDQGIPAASSPLNAARNAGNDLPVRDPALRQAIDQQNRNLDEMKKIVKVMEKWESYQQAINELRNLIDDQGRINQETLKRKKAQEDRIFGGGE